MHYDIFTLLLIAINAVRIDMSDLVLGHARGQYAYNEMS